MGNKFEKGECRMENCLEKGKYRAVFSDIDGTLLNDFHEVTDGTRNKVMELQEAEIPFILVSARMPKGMIAIRDEVGYPNPMICYSGALIVDEAGRYIYDTALEKETAKNLCNYVEEKEPEIAVNIYSEDNWKVKQKGNPWVIQEMQITGVMPEEVDFLREETFEKVHKILCIGEAQAISRLEGQLKERFLGIRIYKSKDTYLEIMSEKASKSGAMKILEKKFGISREETIAFGDAYNDIDMIQYAGIGVAMGNAKEEIKSAADMITASNNEEGVLKVLQLIL